MLYWQKKALHFAKTHYFLPIDGGAKQPHFTFIMKRASIICWGYNRAYQTHPLAKRFEHRFDAIHSELDAIRHFPYPLRELRNYTLLNIRIKKDGTLGNAEPCGHCKKMLRTFGVRKIYHSIYPSSFRTLSLSTPLQ